MAKLYRTMRAAADGHPETGASFATLGARANKDIPLDSVGEVLPGTGGMSTTFNDPKKMRRPARPRELGGESRQPLFELEVDQLPRTLSNRAEPSDKFHHFIEPSVKMSFGNYQDSLHGTREDWKTT